VWRDREERGRKKKAAAEVAVDRIPEIVGKALLV